MEGGSPAAPSNTSNGSNGTRMGPSFETVSAIWPGLRPQSRPDRLAIAAIRNAALTNVPAGWPADRPLAVSVAVMLEGWAAPDAPGIGPMGNPLKPGTIDLQARSWAEYGAKVGAWRLLDLLDQEGVRAVFYTSGVVAERYPELPAAIAKRGHAVAAHGWSQGTLPAYLTEDAEAADIARCVQALSQTAGKHPSGWLSPRCTPSA